MYAVEDMIFSMIPPSRWDSKYCQPLSYFYTFKNFDGKAKIDALESIWYKTKSAEAKKQRKTYKYDDTRYSGFNLHSLFFRGSVEFRYHSGTINSQKILLWTEILLRIFDYAIQRYDSKQITKLFNMQTCGEKLNQMRAIFGFSDSTYKYMKNRISKFNPQYAIRFNKGKEEREETEIKNALYLKSLEKKLTSLIVRLKKIDKKLKPKRQKEKNFWIGENIVSQDWFSPERPRTIDEITDEYLRVQEEAGQPQTVTRNRVYVRGSDLAMDEEPKQMEILTRGKLEEKRDRLLDEAQMVKMKIDRLGYSTQEGFLKKDEVYTLSQMLKKGFSMSKEAEADNEEGEEMKMDTRELSVVSW